MIPQIIKDFIDNTIKILSEDKRIVGITAGGSYKTNNMDEFSDIDLIIVIDPLFFEDVMLTKNNIAEGLGKTLSVFTGEHVGEKRLLICLYGPPLLHVDLKFVSLDDLSYRIEEPVILWERENFVSNKIKFSKDKYPLPDLQWIEDRFWVWIHYATTKIGRGELFETIEFISFLRQTVIGPLTLMKNGKLPRGVRKIEYDAKNDLPVLIKTVASYNIQSCGESIKTLIKLYVELRDLFKDEGFVFRSDAQKYSIIYLDEILDNYSKLD